jgi:hypothetical protein
MLPGKMDPGFRRDDKGFAVNNRVTTVHWSDI